MDTGMLHTHTLVVTLYLIQLLVKVVLLGSGKEEQLEKFSQKTKIPHIVLSVLMVVTGFYLFFKLPTGQEPYVWVKLAFVFGSIPIGIIGMKKKNIAMAGMAFVMIAAAMSLAFIKPAFLQSGPSDEDKEKIAEAAGGDKAMEAKLEKGLQVYRENLCNSCHGMDGQAGAQGSKNLAISRLSGDEIAEIVHNGKNVMKAYPDIQGEDLGALIAFVKSLRK